MIDTFRKPEKEKQIEKVFKIKYYVNLLTSIDQKDGSLMEAIAESNELRIFEAQAIIDLIDFKWEKFGYAA